MSTQVFNSVLRQNLPLVGDIGTLWYCTDTKDAFVGTGIGMKSLNQAILLTAVPQVGGPSGPIGPAGPIGLTGPTGLAAAVALQGPIGPQGSQGLQGLQGPQGIPGTAPTIIDAGTF